MFTKQSVFILESDANRVCMCSQLLAFCELHNIFIDFLQSISGIRDNTGLLNEEINTYQEKIDELKNNKKNKNYIENKINEIKSSLEKCLEDNECYSDVFNELIDRIIVHKQNDKQIKLDIFIKTGESINTFSDNLGKKFHLLDSHTTSSGSFSRN